MPPSPATFAVYLSPCCDRAVPRRPSRWEQEAQFCRHVRSLLKPQRLLDLVDAAVLDFLIQNGDRHHYETLGRGGPMVLIDNGKRSGSPHQSRVQGEFVGNMYLVRNSSHYCFCSKNRDELSKLFK